MLDTLYKVREVYFRLLARMVSCKGKEWRFTTESWRYRQNLKYENFPSSSGRLRQKFAPKGVPHVQHDYFSSFNQSNQWFVALSSLLRSSFLKLPIVSILWNTLGAWRKYDTFDNNQEWFTGRENEWYVDDRKYQFITKLCSSRYYRSSKPRLQNSHAQVISPTLPYFLCKSLKSLFYCISYWPSLEWQISANSSTAIFLYKTVKSSKDAFTPAFGELFWAPKRVKWWSRTFDRLFLAAVWYVNSETRACCLQFWKRARPFPSQVNATCDHTFAGSDKDPFHSRWPSFTRTTIVILAILSDSLNMVKPRL